MPLATETINIDVTLPDGSEFESVTFVAQLSEITWDSTDNEVVANTPISVELDASGVGTISLWPNDRGTKNTFYTASIRGKLVGSNTTREYRIGSFTPTDGDGPFDLNVLLESALQESIITPSLVQRAETAATEAEASATQAEIYRTQASDSAAAASTSAGEAASSADDAVSAAEASGNVLFYDTKADATAALGGLSEGQVVEVFEDESLGGRRTRYRVESSALVFKLYLDPARPIYLDTVTGSDAAPGTDPNSPVQSMSTAAGLLASGDTLWIARGSRFEPPADNSQEFVSGVPEFITIDAYGYGEKPLLDTSIRTGMTGWTQDGTNPDVYSKTITHIGTTQAASPITADVTHYQVWEEWDEDGEPKALMLDGKFDGSTIADNLSYLQANPGSFTCHFVGSTAPDPRTDTAGVSQDVVYYVHLRDGGDPSASTSYLQYAEDYKWLFAKNTTLRNLHIRRSAANSMSGDPDGFQRLEYMDFTEAAIHAWTGPHTARNCYASARRRPGLPFPSGGGAFHHFRNDSASTLEGGLVAENLKAEGFQIAIYCHGTAGGLGQNKQFKIRNVVAINCNVMVQLDQPDSIWHGVQVDGFKAIDCKKIATCQRYSVFKNGLFISKAGAVDHDGLVDAFGETEGDPITLDNVTVIMRNDSGSRRSLIRNVSLSGNTLTANIKNCTLYKIGFPLDLDNRLLVNHVFENSLVGITTGPAPAGISTTGTNFLGYEEQTPEEINATYADYSTDTQNPYQAQEAEFTIAEGDITYFDEGRNASGTSGGTVLTMNVVGASDVFLPGQQCKIVDYDGAGGDFISTIASVDDGANTITLNDTLDQTFSGKDFLAAFHAYKVWGTDQETTGTLSDDGLTLTVADAQGIKVGMRIYLGGIKRREDFGTRKVTAVSGSDLTLDLACDWKKGEQGPLNASVTRPSISVSYGFPLIGETVTLDIVRANTTDVSFSVTGSNNSLARLPNGDYTYRSDFSGKGDQIRFEEGFVDAAIPVAVGDVLTWGASIYVEDLDWQLAADPATTGDVILKPGRLANLGIGSLLPTARTF